MDVSPKGNPTDNDSDSNLKSNRPVPGEQIDLIDIFFKFWPYKTWFFSFLVLFTLVGIFRFEISINSKVEVASFVETPGRIVNGERETVFTPSEIVKIFEHKSVPKLLSDDSLREFHRFAKATKIIDVTEANLVKLVNIVPKEHLAEASQYHKRLVEVLETEVNRSTNAEFAHYRQKVESLKKSIVNLKKILISLEQSLESASKSGAESNGALVSEVIARKGSVQLEIALLTNRIDELELILPTTYANGLTIAEIAPVPGASRTSSYVLLFILSVILALSMLFFVSFVRKVRQRMIDEN